MKSKGVSPITSLTECCSVGHPTATWAAGTVHREGEPPAGAATSSRWAGGDPWAAAAVDTGKWASCISGEVIARPPNMHCWEYPVYQLVFSRVVLPAAIMPTARAHFRVCSLDSPSWVNCKRVIFAVVGTIAHSQRGGSRNSASRCILPGGSPFIILEQQRRSCGSCYIIARFLIGPYAPTKLNTKWSRLASPFWIAVP